jgi:hypothetical protein
MIVVTVPTAGINNVPYITLLVAVQGLQALGKGMKLCRTATPKNCMAIISKVTGNNYKRTDKDKALRDGLALLDSIRQSRRTA